MRITCLTIAKVWAHRKMGGACFMLGLLLSCALLALRSQKPLKRDLTGIEINFSEIGTHQGTLPQHLVFF